MHANVCHVSTELFALLPLLDSHRKSVLELASKTRDL